MLRPYRQKLTLEDAAHLLRRTSFGATPAQIRALEGQTAEQAMQGLMNFSLEEMKENPFNPDEGLKANQEIRLTQLRWLFEMIHSPFPLRERLAFFWHGHFAIGVDKVRNHYALGQYLKTLRNHALSSFEQLTLETLKTPAMLRYLDNDQNKKGKPNENLGRELLELFTVGIGQYSEQDVQESARALTGWSAMNKGPQKRSDARFEFVFRVNEHDDGPKTVLGQRGNFKGQDVVRITSAHPATPRFVGRKIWEAFVAPDPSPVELEALASIWEKSGGNLRQIMTALLSSETFFSRRGAVIRSPLEHAIGSVRALNLPIQDQKFYQSIIPVLTSLGHMPLAPTDVSGWEGGRSWISDGALLTRMQMSAALTLGKKIDAPGGLKDLSLALLGSENTPHKAVLEGLSAPQQAYLMMISPEYGLI